MNEKTKKIILIIIGIALILTFEIIKMSIGIIILLKQIKKTEKIEKQEEELEVINPEEHNYIRLETELANEKLEEKKKVKKETDIRQFQGRNDVTEEEVIEYMMNKSQFIGLIKRGYQLERISEVCNIDNQNIKNIEHELWGKCKIYEDKEGQKERDLWLEIQRKKISYESPWRETKNRLLKEAKTEKDKEIIEKIYTEEYIKEQEETREWDRNKQKFIFYEKWLKEKGYVNE